jgi:sulfur carrier protein ThiS
MAELPGRCAAEGTEHGPMSEEPHAARSEVEVVVELVRANGTRRLVHRVSAGTPVRSLLRELGQAPEGSAVLVDGISVPLDTPIEGPLRLTIVSTFSGG